MDWLNYHHLYYFWIIAEEGSIAKACERLHLTQPTLSNQLKALELRVGQPLFQRVGKQLVLTDMGLSVRRYAEVIFTTGKDLQHFIAGQRGPARRRPLQIGITDFFPKSITYRILEPLLKHRQELSLVCLEDSQLDNLLLRLSQFELDLLLVDTPVAPGRWAKVYNHLLGESGSSFFAVPALAQRYRGNFPNSLASAPLLLPSDSTSLRRSLNAWFANQDWQPDIVGEFDDTALLKVFGQHGHGVFCLPTAIEADVCTHHGVEVIGQLDTIRTQYYAISMERTLRQPLLMRLVELARQHLFV